HLGAGKPALALPPGPLRGSAQIARLGAAGRSLLAADADRGRCRADHHHQLARPLQVPPQPDRLLAWQCGYTDRRVWHHPVGALAVRAAAARDAAEGFADDDSADDLRLHRPGFVL